MALFFAFNVTVNDWIQSVDLQLNTRQVHNCLITFFPKSSMAEESRQIMVDDLKIYSDGLMTALEHDKLGEAREYILRVQRILGNISRYIEAHTLYDASLVASGNATNIARSDAERARYAAHMAQQKADLLEKEAKEKKEESKRLKKAAGNARKEAAKARKNAKSAEKAEQRAEKQAGKASEQAARAGQAARRS